MDNDAFLSEREETTAGTGISPVSGEAGFIEDITQVYLHEIGATPLLTAAQEKELARGRVSNAPS